MGRLYLVRHAKAGERRLWQENDLDRPLSKKGWKQSEAIARRLAGLEPAALVSSPYVRCIQTLEPLSRRLDLPVCTETRLAEEQPVEPVLELLAEVADRSVLCSHGDIIPATIESLRLTGTELRTPVDWRKGSVWVLVRDKRRRIVSATVWPPPQV